jgi:hypothetical protein
MQVQYVTILIHLKKIMPRSLNLNMIIGIAMVFMNVLFSKIYMQNNLTFGHSIHPHSLTSTLNIITCKVKKKY